MQYRGVGGRCFRCPATGYMRFLKTVREEITAQLTAEKQAELDAAAAAGDIAGGNAIRWSIQQQ